MERAVILTQADSGRETRKHASGRHHGAPLGESVLRLFIGASRRSGIAARRRPQARPPTTAILGSQKPKKVTRSCVLCKRARVLMPLL